MKGDYNVELGHRLQILRRYAGFSQEYVAETLDISVREYRRMEKGEVNVTLDTVCSLIEKLDFDTGFLVLGTLTVDTYLNKAMSVMPEEMYDDYLEKLVSMSQEIEEGYESGVDVSEKTKKFFDIVVEISRYGMGHWEDPNVREEAKDDFFTHYLVKNTPERIQRNKIQHS